MFEVWPSLPLEGWKETDATLHMWTQIVGKTRLALSPKENGWWHVALYLTARGLTTSSIPHGTTVFDASYDPQQVNRFRRVLLQADRILKRFRGRFLGKSSPVHFFWGSFDLAYTRFSGRRAPARPDAKRMMQEATSHEEISVGF
jgi:hypothetical protein